MINLSHFRIALAFLCLLATCTATQDSSQPLELQASDPQVKAYIDAAGKLAENGDYSASLQQLHNAFALCRKKGFLADQALLESRLSAASFLQGRLEDTKRYRLASFADSVKTNNLVLQADNLVVLAVMAQLAGDMNEALKLSGQALDTARKSKNLWILARASGELGRMQLLAGKIHEARASVEEALRLDRLNHYSWEPSHLLYLAWITSTGNSNLDQALQLARSARELAVQYEDYLTFMQSSTMLSYGFVYKGKAGDGIVLLEHSRDGLTEDGKPLFPRTAPFKAAMALPYPRIAFLEAMARAYHSANRTADAAAAWNELYQVAKAPASLWRPPRRPTAWPICCRPEKSLRKPRPGTLWPRRAGPPPETGNAAWMLSAHRPTRCSSRARETKP
jgi:tetratricopeptide (TPR) repeat protein